MSSFLPILAIRVVLSRHRYILKLTAATILLSMSSTIGTATADEVDDYVTCLLDTAAKIMKTQDVKDPAKALDEAGRRCKPPPQVT